ncbi:MAG: DUF6642 family protein [Longimicrobiales bacterium]
MPSAKAKGVFCLEGDWDPDLRHRATVGPVLELLDRSSFPAVPHIRRDVGTVEEFEYYLGKWTQRRYAAYPILYLGFHGGPEVLKVGDQRKGPVTLDWLEERLKGSCKGRLIHFGSCATLDTHGNRLRRFLQRTGAVAMCGYREDVDWMLSAAFELILLYQFQFNALTRAGMAAVNRRVRRGAANLARDLKFRMVIAP